MPRKQDRKDKDRDRKDEETDKKKEKDGARSSDKRHTKRHT